MKELIIEKRESVVLREEKTNIFLLLVRRSIKIYSYFVFAETEEQVLNAYIGTFSERPSEKVVNIIDIETVKKESTYCNTLMTELIDSTKAIIFFDSYRNSWSIKFYCYPCMSKFNLYKNRKADIIFLMNHQIDSFFIEKLESIVITSRMIKRESINIFDIPVIDDAYSESMNDFITSGFLDFHETDVYTDKYELIIVDSVEITVDELIELWSNLSLEKYMHKINIELLILCKDNLLEVSKQKDGGLLFMPIK